jgi:hypothetical protein
MRTTQPIEFNSLAFKVDKNLSIQFMYVLKAKARSLVDKSGLAQLGTFPNSSQLVSVLKHTPND